MNPHSTATSLDSEEEQCRRAESTFRAATTLKWLDDCVYQDDIVGHRNCAHLRQRERSLPKRVVDVGIVGNWPCMPKLIETSPFDPKDTKYVALSHVWGSLTGNQREAMSTTASSLLARQEGIRLATMPLQYRAVVILCRCLHFRYLWIDSLCIIQVSNDEHNWNPLSYNFRVLAGTGQKSLLGWRWCMAQQLSQ